MEKNRQVLGNKGNFDRSILDFSSVKKKQNQQLKDCRKRSSSKDSMDIENEIKISHSNYKSFLWKWHKNPKYPLPSSFKIIHVNNRSEQSLSNDYQWFNFPILSFSCKQLCSLAVKIIASPQFQPICDKQTVNQVVSAICFKYNIVSYHNFSHGFSLMHMLYQLTKLDPNFKKMYTDEEIGYCFIAALAHDINHSGTNNLYQVKMKTQLAKSANNEAVLQKMHVKVFFDLLKQNNQDIFKKSTNPSKMKELITRNILATDFAQHFKNLQKLKTLAPTLNEDWRQQQNRNFYMTQAFHACDIGNPCLEHQQYMNWAALLSYQFNTQTLMETQNKFEVTEMLRYKSQKMFYQGQIGFINNFVYPMWKQLANCWPGFNFLVENIQTNLKILQVKSEKQIIDNQN